MLIRQGINTLLVRFAAILLFSGGGLFLADGCAPATRQEPVMPRQDASQQQITELERLLGKKDEQIEKLESRVKEVETELAQLQKELADLRVLGSAEVIIKEGLLEIPAGGKTEIAVEITPAPAVPLVTFEIEDPNVATAEPAFAISAAQTLRITAAGQGQTRLIAKVEGHPRAEVTIIIRQPPSLTAIEKFIKGISGTPLLLITAVAAFVIAYILYGRFLNKRYEIDDSHATPSHSDYDGIDRVPAQKGILLGHHFSSIAGAGPIVGPVIAAIAFGWLPVLGWIILGSIFIGGVHDFSSLVASVRHRARSIAEIAKEYMSPLAWKLFLAFAWFTLVYVLTVFLDLTAATFVESGSVATSSILFIILAIAFGLCVYQLKMSLLYSSLIFVPLVFAAVWLGQIIPLPPERIPVILAGNPAKTWCLLLLIYCFIASTTPVWILLQPRDYLSSFLLYASVIGGALGILIGGFKIEYPAFRAWSAPQLGMLFPMLFITVACGACSGFHSLVASGTSSKQINKESDAKLVGYGAMLVEGIVAVIALCAVAIIAQKDGLAKIPPQTIYADGLGKFFSATGVPFALGRSFGLLAMSAFILTTLDTATRLSRYIFEEFFGLKSASSRYPSTLATLVLPAILVLITLKDAAGNPLPAWKAIWPVFGATNQLLAGLTLLVVAVWLKKTGRKTGFVLVPMAFMNITTLTALVLLLNQYGFSAVGIIAGILLVLGLVLVYEAYRTVIKTSSWNLAGKGQAG
jgi:carbon starvation protein